MGIEGQPLVNPPRKLYRDRFRWYTGRVTEGNILPEISHSVRCTVTFPLCCGCVGHWWRVDALLKVTLTIDSLHYVSPTLFSYQATCGFSHGLNFNCCLLKSFLHYLYNLMLLLVGAVREDCSFFFFFFFQILLDCFFSSLVQQIFYTRTHIFRSVMEAERWRWWPRMCRVETRSLHWTSSPRGPPLNANFAIPISSVTTPGCTKICLCWEWIYCMIYTVYI